MQGEYDQSNLTFEDVQACLFNKNQLPLEVIGRLIDEKEQSVDLINDLKPLTWITDKVPFKPFSFQNDMKQIKAKRSFSLEKQQPISTEKLAQESIEQKINKAEQLRKYRREQIKNVFLQEGAQIQADNVVKFYDSTQAHFIRNNHPDEAADTRLNREQFRSHIMSPEKKQEIRQKLLYNRIAVPLIEDNLIDKYVTEKDKADERYIRIREKKEEEIEMYEKLFHSKLVELSQSAPFNTPKNLQLIEKMKNLWEVDLALHEQTKNKEREINELTRRNIENKDTVKCLEEEAKKATRQKELHTEKMLTYLTHVRANMRWKLENLEKNGLPKESTLAEEINRQIRMNQESERRVAEMEKTNLIGIKVLQKVRQKAELAAY